MTWKAQPCKHGKMGPAGGCEECWKEAMEKVRVHCRSEGLERAAKIIEEGAVEAFKSGADSYAKTLRQIRDMLLKEIQHDEPQPAPEQPEPEPQNEATA